MDIDITKAISYMDAQGVYRLLDEVFETPVNEPRPVFIRRPATYVASAGTRVFGFVDGFVTSVYEDVRESRRLELDLLAVEPTMRGRGLARRLVAALLQDADLMRLEPDCARALVTIDNAPMHSVMRACDFELQADVCGLYVSTGDVTDVTIMETDNQEPSEDGRIVPVQTLTYDGLWLEGRISRGLVRRAWQRQRVDHHDLIGVVIPDHDDYGRMVVQGMGFELVSKYQWWQYSY